MKSIRFIEGSVGSIPTVSMLGEADNARLTKNFSKKKTQKVESFLL